MRTVDGHGKPVAFVWFALMPQVQHLEINGGVLIPSTDSRGLLRLTLPANVDATLRLSERRARPISVATDEPTVVVVPATSLALVRLPFDTRVAGARWLSGDNPMDSYGSSTSGTEGTAALLLCSPVTPVPRVELRPCEAAPFELGGELQDPAHARNGICWIDRRQLLRDLQVTFAGPDGKPLDDMTVVLASDARTKMLTMCTKIAVRDPARPHAWRLRALDREAHELVACHPEHLDAAFVMPRLEARQADGPLVVPMQRGAGLTFTLTPGTVLERAETERLQLTLVGEDGRPHTFSLELWHAMQASKDQPVTVRVPRGLLPGRYRVTFEATKIREPLGVTLASDGPLVLDLDLALRDAAKR